MTPERLADGMYEAYGGDWHRAMVELAKLYIADGERVRAIVKELECALQHHPGAPTRETEDPQ